VNARRALLTAALLGLLATAPLAAPKPQPEPLQPNPNTGETVGQFVRRTDWWRDAKFGMFIHWGLYAVPADSTDRAGNKGIGEWYFSNKQMQIRDYERFAGQFNPVKFDARQWVKIAKGAGMKYIVITSKHHDGFCMFDSKLTDYTITKATPFRRDPLKELAEECRKQGLTLCFYHSIMDWHHPDYLPRRPWEAANRPTAGASLPRYVTYMEGQLRELLTNYGRVGGIWFDGGWEHTPQELRSAEVNRMIRELQPGIIINDRNHLPEDHSTPEQTIPANALPGGRLWETCMTMNDTWGFAKNDANWKPTDDLLRKLCDIASKGGNFLLNVGPTGEGEIPEASVERLARVGEWMKVNGRSIYGTTKSPFRRLPFDGRCTRKGNTLYLQVFSWPAGELTLSGLQTPIRSARALAGGERLRVTSATGEGGVVTLRIPRPKQLDPLATVIELKLDGPPVVASVVTAQPPAADGSFILIAKDAEIHGQTAAYESGGGKDNIGFWTNAADWVSWPVAVPRAGRYTVEVTYACPNDEAGTAYSVGLERGPIVGGTTRGTGSWTAFQSERLSGTLDLVAGKQDLQVRVTRKGPGAVMNLQRLVLQPYVGF
jgi:alpha-L-fucosidase